MKLATWSGMSLMNMMNKMGPTTLPWGTPRPTADQIDVHPLTLTHCRLPLRKASNHLRIFPCIPSASIFLSDLWCGTESNALAKSRKIASTVSHCYKNDVQLFRASNICVVHDLWPTNECWYLNSKLFLFKWSSISSLTRNWWATML